VPEADHKETRVHRFDHAGAVLLCAHNLADGYREEVVELDVDPDAVEHVVGDGGYHVEDGGVTFLLDECDYVWIRGER
jgi:maltose alpha-D-glucosyltransferase/alpha-amylase